MTILTNILLLTALTAYLLIVGFVFTGQMNDILKGYHFRPKDAAPDDDYEVLIGGEGELAILFEEKLKENGVSCLRILEFDSKAREEMMAVSSRWHEDVYKRQPLLMHSKSMIKPCGRIFGKSLCFPHCSACFTVR